MIHPDNVTEEEFKNATHERRQVAVATSRIEYVTARYRDALVDIVRQANVLGMHIEIKTVSNWPPAMGNVSSEIEVRPSLHLWREIEELEAQAKLSEMTDAERATARGDHVLGSEAR